MRIFLAIPVPRDVERELLLIQHRFPEADLRFANSFHITLKFLGEIDATQVAAVQKLLSGLRFSPFSLTLGDLGAFQNWKQPTVIWAGIQQSKQLEQLQFACASRLKSFGKEEQKFHAHITLARTEGLSEAQGTQIRDIQVKPLPFAVDRVVLYESTLTADGPVYREITEFLAA